MAYLAFKQIPESAVADPYLQEKFKTTVAIQVFLLRLKQALDIEDRLSMNKILLEVGISNSMPIVPGFAEHAMLIMQTSEIARSYAQMLDKRK